MNEPLKTFLRIAGVIVGIGAAAWALRDKLLPAPAIPDEPPPRFRTGAPSSDDLTDIKGVGPARSDRLQAAGYDTIQSLIDAGPEAVGDAAGVSAETAAKWLTSAAQL